MKHVGNRGPVRNLLHIHSGPISKLALIGFSQDWVQRFVESMCRPDESYRCDHHKLHSLHRVPCKCCGIKVHGSDAPYRSHELHDTFVTHDLNRKADSREVELSGNDLLAYLLDQVLPCASVLRDHILIGENKPSILVSVLCLPEFISARA